MTEGVHNPSQVQETYVQDDHSQEVWEADHEGLEVPRKPIRVTELRLNDICDRVYSHNALKFLSHIVILNACVVVAPLNVKTPTSSFPKDYK